LPPFVLVTSVFALGIVISELNRGRWVWAAVVGAAIFLAAGIWYYRWSKRYSFLWLPLCFMCLGYVWMGINFVSFPQQFNPFLGHFVQVEGVVDELPSVYPNSLVFVLDEPVVTLDKDRWQGDEKLQVVYYIAAEKTDDESTPPQLTATTGSTRSFAEKRDDDSRNKLVVPGAAGIGIEAENLRSKLLPGAVVRVEGFIELAEAALSPGEFDYRAYLKRRGIIAQVQAKGIPEVISQRQGLGSFWAGLRLRIENGINTTLPRDESLFLKEILLGSKEGMTPDDRDIYQRTGVMHLFAVSGLHLGFVFAALMAAAGLFGLKRIPTFIMVTAGIWGYAALIDFTSPITRAAIMATVGLAAYLWQQRQNAMNSLALAALVLLLLNPSLLFDPGFQLSFTATWGIIYLAVPLNRHIPLPAGIREAITVPLAAQLAILPLIASYFNQVAILGLLANILVVPLAGFVVYLGLVGMMLALAAPALFNPFFLAAGALSIPIKGLLSLLAELPSAAFFVPPPPLWLYLLWFGILLLLGWALREGFTVSFPHFRFRSAATSWVMPSLLVITFCLILLCTGIWRGSSGQLEVTFFNVGQGDAALVRTPAGRTMLVDAGGSPSYLNSSYEPGRQVVVPALARAGIKELDLVVNSHPHEDHLGGIPAVLDNIKVGRYAAPPIEHVTPLVIQVQQLLEEKKIPVNYIHSGAEIKLDPAVKISVLGPPETPFSGTRSDANNNSLILHIAYGKVSFLLTGDVEQEGMLDLVERIQNGRTAGEIKADVLKCPHHGSSYSICQEFADAVRPQIVVISVGNNNFGHPAAETICFWQEQGAQVLRTDKEGHIILVTDGAKLSRTER
jgi:competence protein ComEC